ncbi:Pathogenesis-related protein PR-1, related [Eimeria mitis]|uniref:Pathogenesis-related protein PR-1, related n=1 Tax=Eimeria mitis TaxID=44415 RepID=U6KIJ4_9EIME|nr:Pathogenesis-related protein PR-1, related [Eimeria mitis]CDJ36621.1 Pathogenesis-related protein PR-1, related [Eimeria mitis]
MDQFRDHMVHTHNAIRRRHSTGDLKWNPLIAANVLHYLRHQDQYQQCRMQHSPQEDRKLPDIKGGLGENLYTACSIGELPREVVDAWSGEGNCFRYGKIGNPCTGVLGPKCSIESHAEGLMTGHYTATVWNDSKELGCAYVVCKRECQNNRPLLLVGCQYTPAGNIVGQAPFPKETAVKLQSFYPQLLPGAPEDPEQIKKCEEFRKEMKMKNPRVDLVEKAKRQ